MLISDLRSRSGASSYSSMDRVRNWVNRNDDVEIESEPTIEPERLSVPEFPVAPLYQSVPLVSGVPLRQSVPDYPAAPLRKSVSEFPAAPLRQHVPQVPTAPLRQSVPATPLPQLVPEIAAVPNGMTEVLSQAFKALQGRNVRELPLFSGNVMDWPIFLNEYEITTKEHKLSNSDNLRRLNKALQGKARKAVESLLASPENVEQIMRMLKSNFGRTEWIVSNRLEILRNLDQVKHNNIDSFRHFFNAVVGTAVALKNIKAEIYLMNPDLIAHLAEKLPGFSRQMWVRHKATLMRENKPVDFEAFSRWLEDEMDNQLAGINSVPFGKKQVMDAKPRQPVLNVNFSDEDEYDEQQNQPLLNVNSGDESDCDEQKNKPVLSINERDKQRKKCPVCGSAEHKSLAKCGKFVKLSVEQRRSVARNCKVCYICLEGNHIRGNCKSNRSCTVCKKNHHELVHADEVPRRSFCEPEAEPDSSEELCNVNSRCSNTLLRVCKVRVCSGKVVHHVFALFDEGSSISMIDASFARKMRMSGPIQPVTYRWTNGISHKDDQSMLLNLHISGQADDATWFELNNVRTINNINLPTVELDVGKIKSLYPLLDENMLNDIKHVAPVLLIGSNNAGLIVPLETVQYSVQGLQLTRCHLGWTIHGEIESILDDPAEQRHTFLCSESEDVKLTSWNKQVLKSGDFEDTRSAVNIADKKESLNILRRTRKRCGDRFGMVELCKFNKFTFPDRKPQALCRSQEREKQMDADLTFTEQYNQKIQAYLDKRLNADELERISYTWNQPSLSETKENKIGLKVNAKLELHGFSLLKSSDLVHPLIDVMMSGRMKKIVLTAVIMKMVHQVITWLLNQESQRYLWCDMNRRDPLGIYVMKAVILGVVSSPSIAAHGFTRRKLDSSTVQEFLNHSMRAKPTEELDAVSQSEFDSKTMRRGCCLRVCCK